MLDMTKLEARCVAAAWNIVPTTRNDDPDSDMLAIVRAVLTEVGIAGEPEINYEIWQDDEMQASSTSEADGRHYAAVYGQDGPVELVCAVTYRQKMLP